jgi:hypothetical protein
MTDTDQPALNVSDRPAKALDAARDCLKQVITIDAALLTFGVTFIQNITKSRGRTGFIDTAIILLLVSISLGVLAVIFTVGQTHSRSGSINDCWVRWPAFGCIVSFVAGIAFIGWYVFGTPITAGTPATTSPAAAGTASTNQPGSPTAAGTQPPAQTTPSVSTGGPGASVQTAMSKFPPPASVKTTVIGSGTVGLQWETVPSGSIYPTSYTVAVYNNNGQFASESTVSTPDAANGQGVITIAGLKPRTSYHANVWPNGGSLAPSNTSVSFTTK